jgi:hypothetical protein
MKLIFEAEIEVVKNSLLILQKKSSFYSFSLKILILQKKFLLGPIILPKIFFDKVNIQRSTLLLTFM